MRNREQDQTSTFQRKISLWQKIRSDPHLSPTEKVVASVLLDYFNEERGYAWPSISCIAGAIGKSERTVERSLIGLKDKYFTIRRGGGNRPGGNGKSNEYIPIWNTPPEVTGYEAQDLTKSCSKPTQLTEYVDKNVGYPPSNPSVHKVKYNQDKNTVERSASRPGGRLALINKKPAEKRIDQEAHVRKRLAENLGWEVVMAAYHQEDPNHLQAVQQCRSIANSLALPWRGPGCAS